MNFSNRVCKVCEKEEENLEHVLLQCEGIMNIWNSIETVIKKM